LFLRIMNELALFAGVGGGILGGKLLGWRTVCAVEINTYCARRLMQRQNEGHLSPFPIWDDVCTFDGKPWRGVVDVVSGGFPCQDISVAGKGAGIDGERSGLWSEMRRIICEVRPGKVLLENSPMLVSRGLARVLSDLASMGYDAKWGYIAGYQTGHETNGERLWLVAAPTLDGSQILCPDQAADGHQAEAEKNANELDAASHRIERLEKSLGERALCGTPDEVANRLDRFRAVGNGQDPGMVKTAWDCLAV
jgi:DNA (cytosine-5)-methyltransferase 1